MEDHLQRYVGRFAPTPSGPLHFGSIVAALGSYLDARANRGTWLVRMDDLDTPRVKPGAADGILRSLEQLGLYWDGSILHQDRRRDAYIEAEQQLETMGLLFPCYCPRRRVKGAPYPGTCRREHKDNNRQYALRIRTEPGIYTLRDLVQEDYAQDLSREVGDFIVRRADSIHAYHLAVVVDDACQRITHMVRGADLMASCPRQIYLQQKLGLPTPTYAHLPLAVSTDGVKISKQELAEDVLLLSDPVSILVTCLEFLGQDPDPSLRTATVEDVLHWAVGNWSLAKVPKKRKITAPGLF